MTIVDRADGTTRRRRIVTLLAAATLAAGVMAGVAGGAAPALAAPPGQAPAVPRPGSFSRLAGVYCTSATACRAVGTYRGPSGPDLNQVLRWNGKAWSQVRVPSPGAPAGFSALYAVRCFAAGSCWAVGEYARGGAELDQALHWNGRTWSRVTTPSPAGTGSGDASDLTDIACTSSASCWAAGSAQVPSGSTVTIRNLILHWNGRKWSRVRTPDPGGTGAGDESTVTGIRCTSASNCLAVGLYRSHGVEVNEALRWNGASWTQVTTPDPGGTASGDFNSLAAVSCANASHCWAVGTYGAGSTILNQVLSWNGRAWSAVTVPDPDGTGSGATNDLTSAACTSVANCWAVGSYGRVSGGLGLLVNQALHWDGATWSLVTTPDPGGAAALDFNGLTSVRCAAPASCWAVGSAQKSGTPEFNVALHWNGTKWTSK